MMMEREGKTLKTLAPGDKRRMSDAKSAWRNMTPDQRVDLVQWMYESHPEFRIGSSGKLRVNLEDSETGYWEGAEEPEEGQS